MTLHSLCFSNLCSVLLQWKFEQEGEFWIIENVIGKKFANVEPGESVAPGVQLAATISREWELHFDEELGGWR